MNSSRSPCGHSRPASTTLTAISCIHRLGVVLCTLAEKVIPSPYRHDEDGRLPSSPTPAAVRGKPMTALFVFALTLLAAVLVSDRRPKRAVNSRPLPPGRGRGGGGPARGHLAPA